MTARFISQIHDNAHPSSEGLFVSSEAQENLHSGRTSEGPGYSGWVTQGAVHSGPYRPIKNNPFIHVSRKAMHAIWVSQWEVLEPIGDLNEGKEDGCPTLAESESGARKA